MGLSVSRYSDLTNNEYLVKFCSKDVISSNDPFWNRFLSFNITPPKNADDQLFLDSSTDNLFQQFLAHNLETGNLGALVQVFITRATELLASPSTDNAMLAWQTFNALFVIRCVAKYLIETVPEYQLCQHFDYSSEKRGALGHRPTSNGPVEHKVDLEEDSGKPASETAALSPESKSEADGESNSNGTKQPGIQVVAESKLEMFIDALVLLIIDVPVTDNTYYLHLEAINSILILLSVYLFAHIHGQERAIETSLIYRTIFQGRYSIHAPLMIKTLLGNYSSMHLAPEHMFGMGAGGGSMVLGLASGIWSILTFSASQSGKRTSILQRPAEDRRELAERLTTDHAVANQSCLLALALTNHCMSQHNLYRSALFRCEDSAEHPPAPPRQSAPRVPLAGLHAALCATAGAEHAALALYLMLHGCGQYRRHVAARHDIDNLVLPIMKNLYNAPDSNSHHIYMSLIILLILTEDDKFNRRIHDITVRNLSWYTERSLTEISLGGLLVLVIIRTVQYNMLRVRDKYLHTNCLAALANMSGEFRNLHPYVAQRLVSLFETLSKRHTRLLQRVGGDTVATMPSSQPTAQPNGTSEPQHSETVIIPEVLTEEMHGEIMQDIMVLGEVLRMVLEILNSCLSSQLPANVNLVYALLYKRHVFSQYRLHQDFQDVIQNIEMVVGYFSSRLQRVQEQRGGDLGVTEVLHTIKKGAEQWSSDRLRKFPDLKFRYVEEDKPEEFFTPYVWSLVASCGSVYWASETGAKAIRDVINC